MKKQCIRLFSLLAALILVLGTVPALAEGEWACPNCGKADNTGNFCSNCGAARPAEAPEAPEFNDQLEQIPGETDCVKVLVYSVDAHDYIVAKDPMRWYFTNAVDGNEKTCWQFSSAKEGVLGNAWLEMALASPQTVDSLWILPGNRNNDTSYNNNARPRSIRVEFLYAGDTE
ncbi:MAG: hypothetical protein IJS53_00815, partial [Clostridia bacterium]|nr:hypothetical protein [Clostridia bacterium]